MLRRSFLRGAVAGPLLTLFPFIGKRKSRGNVNPSEPDPTQPTSGFRVFIPIDTRATYERLHRIACCAALEIAAFEYLPLDGIHREPVGFSSLRHAIESHRLFDPDKKGVSYTSPLRVGSYTSPLRVGCTEHLPSDYPTRAELCDWWLEYIRDRNPVIHRLVLMELKSIHKNGKLERAEPWSSTGYVRHSDVQWCLELEQANFCQRIKGTMCWIGGEQTFCIERRCPGGSNSHIYHIDVPEFAADAIKHIDQVEKACPKGSDGRDMYRWFRESMRIQAGSETTPRYLPVGRIHKAVHF